MNDTDDDKRRPESSRLELPTAVRVSVTEPRPVTEGEIPRTTRVAEYQKADESAAAEFVKARQERPEGPTPASRQAASSVEYDSRGRPIPPEVERLPSGKLPSNFSYADRVFDGGKWTPELAANYPDGVKFTADGFPDFSPYAIDTVTIEPQFTGDRRIDASVANLKSALEAQPEDTVWHHHQDGKTMQLLPEELHEAIRHAGGVAIVRGRLIT